ncbi:hypothetical protein AWE51_00385 [Aquimarina aggregata]|uniref:DoxX family protein n=1 Tax=Aquimarina aggregata TaxID=1642818 RepID=A0A163C033_9FLAO|nr:DoxX family protein [Aquimarina aggregata]KZS41935.1 hypothetical protein AWE51_00385 [Aquimarina aggregata]
MINLKKTRQSFLNKFFLRFIFLYLIFYIYPYGFEYVNELNTDDISFWKDITIWFGEFILGWEFDKEYLLNGFDSKYDYSRFLLITLLSVFGATIWVYIDSKIEFKYDSKLKTLTRTILRYHVGLTLIIYGLAKVFMLQFGEMDLDTLERTVGDHTGMGFLWIFMSHSKVYTMFTGWVEVIGGILLLFRKSTFLGAFILFIAMINVVIIDIGYDVRVKMFAIHLLLMTILLISNDIKRLLNFFVFNKPVDPIIESPLFSNEKIKKIGYLIKGSILLYFIISCFFTYSNRIRSQKRNKYSYMTGFHNVEVQKINGDTIPSSMGHRWKSISFNGNSRRPESLKIISINNKKHTYSFSVDTIQKTIMFKLIKDTLDDIYKFRYKELPSETFVFQGSHKGDSILIKTKVKTLKDYRLTKNGIQWITDEK